MAGPLFGIEEPDCTCKLKGEQDQGEQDHQMYRFTKDLNGLSGV